MGGHAQYEMAIFDLCDRMIEDKTLAEVYGNFESSSLADMQKEFLDLAFLENEEDRDTLEARVFLHHFRLFELGLSEKHFDAIEMHLVESLRHAWVDEDVIAEASDRVESLRHLFVLMNKESSTVSINLHEEDEDASDPVALRDKKGRSKSGEGLLAMLSAIPAKRARKRSDQ